jgi:hypothetical protein
MVPVAALLAGLTMVPHAASAAPMSFKGSSMVMGDFSRNWQEVWANHAVTARDAIGAGTLRMRSDDGSKTRQLTELNYTRLVSRWNLAAAQANVWFFMGAGGMRGNDFAGTRTALAPGLQVDYETTRLYGAATARLYRAGDVRHDTATLKAGFSFYEADYDEVQPWLVLEARRMRGLSVKTELTPLLRLIHNRFFVEVGVNNASEARANLMLTF